MPFPVMNAVLTICEPRAGPLDEPVFATYNRLRKTGKRRTHGMEEQSKQRMDKQDAASSENGRVPFEDLISELRY